MKLNPTKNKLNSQNLKNKFDPSNIYVQGHKLKRQKKRNKDGCNLNRNNCVSQDYQPKVIRYL